MIMTSTKMAISQIVRKVFRTSSAWSSLKTPGSCLYGCICKPGAFFLGHPVLFFSHYFTIITLIISMVTPFKRVDSTDSQMLPMIFIKIEYRILQEHMHVICEYKMGGGMLPESERNNILSTI